MYKTGYNSCVQALIGAYLISCGPRGALLFMTWLGVEVLPKDDQGRPLSLQAPPSPLIVTPAISAPERHLAYLLVTDQSEPSVILTDQSEPSNILTDQSEPSQYYTN